MTKEYINQLCEMLLKDNLTQNGKRKIVNYIEFLQQRIDKAIDYLKETTFDFGTDEMMFDKCNAYILLSILQGKDVKDDNY